MGYNADRCNTQIGDAEGSRCVVDEECGMAKKPCQERNRQRPDEWTTSPAFGTDSANGRTSTASQRQTADTTPDLLPLLPRVQSDSDSPTRLVDGNASSTLRLKGRSGRHWHISYPYHHTFPPFSPRSLSSVISSPEPDQRQHQPWQSQPHSPSVALA